CCDRDSSATHFGCPGRNSQGELLRLRAAEERRETCAYERATRGLRFHDREFASVLLIAVGSLPAGRVPRLDLATRRRIELELRAEIAAVLAKKADECDQQGCRADVVLCCQF